MRMTKTNQSSMIHLKIKMEKENPHFENYSLCDKIFSEAGLSYIQQWLMWHQEPMRILRTFLHRLSVLQGAQGKNQSPGLSLLWGGSHSWSTWRTGPQRRPRWLWLLEVALGFHRPKRIPQDRNFNSVMEGLLESCNFWRKVPKLSSIFKGIYNPQVAKYQRTPANATWLYKKR